jgi:predicted RNase H-like HicB family nuclease
MMTETKQRLTSSQGITYPTEYRATPFTAVQNPSWQSRTSQISFVLHPRTTELHTGHYWMSAMTLTAVYQQSGDWWAAWIEELPGAQTQGRTLDEARENLREAAQLILEEGEVPEESHEPLAPGAIREPLTVMA